MAVLRHAPVRRQDDRVRERATSLKDQALGPIANPIEMGNTHAGMEQSLSAVAGYKPYFKEAFGTEQIHGAFKTPGLREVAKRAPYMHDASIATLRDVAGHTAEEVSSVGARHSQPLAERLGLTRAQRNAAVDAFE
jgi:cytochrome c peroxidase